MWSATEFTCYEFTATKPPHHCPFLIVDIWENSNVHHPFPPTKIPAEDSVSILGAQNNPFGYEHQSMQIR